MIRTQRLTDRFLSLTKIDSPSFGEREIADRLTGELRTLGFAVSEDGAGARIGGDAGNLFAALPGAGEAAGLPPLLFAAHMDTVEPSRGKKARLLEDGRIVSDGATVLGADDVSGLSAILEAAASIREDGRPHRPLEVLFTVAEEPYDFGSEAFDGSPVRAKEAYVLDLDGPVGGAAVAAPSIGSFSAEILGRASHAGFAPEKGVHAVAAAALAVSRLKMGRLDHQTTLNVGVIDGGHATNIVPERCLVRGEVRSASHTEACRVLGTVRNVFEQTAASFGASCRFEARFGCRAYEMQPGSPAVRRYEAACGAAGVPMQLRRTFGGSDASQLTQRGIAALVVSCAMYRSHSCAEYTAVQDLEKVCRIVENLMLRP